MPNRIPDYRFIC